MKEALFAYVVIESSEMAWLKVESVYRRGRRVRAEELYIA